MAYRPYIWRKNNPEKRLEQKRREKVRKALRENQTQRINLEKWFNHILNAVKYFHDRNLLHLNINSK